MAVLTRRFQKHSAAPALTSPDGSREPTGSGMKYAQIEEKILGGTTARRGDVVITRGEGSWVFDEDGKKYLDLGSAQGVAMLGHCHPGVTEAIQSQAATLTLCPSYLYNDKRAEFAKALVDVLPKHMPFVFLANSGAEAMDGALKFARLA